MTHFTRPLLLLAVCLPLVHAACGGGQDPTVPPQVQEARAERVMQENGEQTARVVVRMDRDFTLARANVPLASRIELDVPDATTGGTRRVLVATAEVSSENPREIVLTVDTLLPDGTQLRIDRRAFDRDAEGEITATVESELSPVFVLLATREFHSLRPGLFEPAVAAPVTEADRDPDAMRALLEEHLAMRDASEDQKALALERYDSVPAEIVPSPKMRAALAALTGTFADPAFDYLLTDQNCTEQPAALIAFQPPPDGPDLLGRSTRTEDGARVISLHPSAEGDRLEHIMALLTHEAIHCDNRDGRFEEVAATAFDTFLYMQLIAVDPTLVESNTPLSRDLNVDVVAMINSGRTVPESIGILKSPDVAQAVPGTNAPAESFGDLVIAAYPGLRLNASGDEPLADAYAAELAMQAGMAAESAFDLQYLDELLGRALPPEVLGRSLLALQMEPVS